MKQPEQFNSRKEWENFAWDKVADGLVGAGSRREVDNILNKLLGEYEKKLILRRLTAILLIRDGLSYSQIGEILWTSPSTISSIKKSLKQKSAYVARPTKVRRSHSGTQDYYTEKSAVDNFLEQFVELLANLQRGYTDPKYRWRFLQRK